MTAPTHLLIRSIDRQVGGSPSDFTVTIPQFGGRGRLTLLSSSIPNTLYNITAENEMIYWERAAVAYSAAIPNGAYGVDDLLLALPAAMLAADAAGGYNATYSYVTLKLGLTSTDATFQPTTTNRVRAAWDVLGWQALPLPPAGMVQAADSVIRLDFPAYLLLDIGLPGADVITTGHKRSNYIIPMTGISQYVEVTNRNDTFDQRQQYTLEDGVASLRVRLWRPDGSPAELNGSEWSFVIGITCGTGCGC